MAGYSARQSTFTTGDTITAAHSNNEFNAILAAFHVSTGHKHDGSTAGDGGPISTLFSNAISMGTGADTDIAVTFNANSNDGVITWMEDEDYFQFSDDLLLSTTEKIQFRDTAIYINSSADGQLDLVADTEIQIAATTVDINGNVDISGSLTLGGTTITSTGAELNILDGVTATATELNILDGVTSTTAELNILDGVTSTTAELNILDGVTSTAAELNLVDGITPGTVTASKAIIVDSNKDLTGIRNLTIAGDLTISGDDLTMATNTAGNLLIADGTNYNPTAVGDLSEISSVASDDVLLAVDTSGGGLKKITRSTLVSGLATSSGIANLAEDSTPQLGGDLDVNGNGLVSTSNGNITLTPNGSGVVRIDGSNGIDMQSGSISIKNSGTQSYVRFYCESSNAHYAQLQAPAHANFGGNITLTLPAATDTLVGKATTDTLTNKTLTSAVLNTGVSGTAVADEDDMSSNSATKLATQQSIKAYVDAQITAEDLDITSDSGTIAIDLDSETLTIAGGTGIDSSATSNTVTLAIDSTVATLSGSQTLTNKTIDASQLSGTVANARLDAELQAIAGLTSAADKGIQFTGSGTAGVYDLTAAGKALLDDADAAAQRTTLGLGTAATQAVGTSASNVVQLDGSAKLPAVDGSALTNLPPSGGVVSLVADGNIAIRKPVILTAAGKAKQIAETTTVASDPSTKLADLDGSDTTNSTVHTEYEPTSGKFVMLYKDTSNSSYPTIVAGTWDDNNTGSITWGTPEVLNSAATTGGGLALAAGNGRIHATYQSGSPGSGNLNLRTATIGSDLTFSGFSTAVDTFGDDQSGTYSGAVQLAFDTSTNYLITTYTDATDGTGSFYAIPIHINGTTYTTGSASTIHSGAQADYRVGLVFDPDTNRTILAYKDNSNSGYTTVNVIQSSGTSGSPSLTVGSDVVVDSSGGGTTSLTYDTTNNKVFLTYELGADPEIFGAIGTVNSGTNSISFTTPATIIDTTSSYEHFDTVYFEDQNKIYFVYKDRDAGDDLTYKIITPGASSFSVGSAVEVSENLHNMRPGSASAGVGKGVLFGLEDYGDSSKVAYLSFYNASSTASNLDNGNYLGIAAEAISDTATGKINVIGGTSTGHSSLTIGNHYFTNGAGTIGLVGNTTGEQYLGRAISATEIQLLENEGYLYGTAEGAVTAGKPVFVEADGDFLMPVSTTTTYTHSAGTATEILDGNVSRNISTCYAANVDRFVVLSEDSNVSKVKLVTVGSDNAVAVAATETINSTAYAHEQGIIDYDVTNEKVLLVYKSGTNSNDLRCRVLTIGASSVSAGSEVIIDDSNHTGTDMNLCYDTTNSKFVLFTRDQSNSNYPTAYVGSISGTTPSFGAAQVVTSSAAGVCLDNAFGGDKFLFSYRDGSNDLAIKAATLSGTTLTFGSEYELDDEYPSTNNGYQDSMCYVEPADLFAVGYDISGDTVKLKGVKVADDRSILMGYETGESSSANTNTTTGNMNNAATPRKVETLTVPMVYRDDNNRIKYDEFVFTEASGEVVGFKINKVGYINLNNDTNYHTSMAQAGAAQNYRGLICYEDDDNDIESYGIHPVGTRTTTTLPSGGKGFIGIATKTVADNAQVEVATMGQIDAQQSGLTAGETYFAQSDGSLSTSADVLGSVTVGKALSATKILIQ